MSQYIAVFEDGNQKNDITVIVKDYIVVAHAYRSDFEYLSSTEEVSYPGIYILLGEDKKVYVGQASRSMLSRIKSHYKDKLWWDEILMITTKTKDINKSQLDYMEKKLIDKFITSNNFYVINSNMGNISHIENYHIISCNILLNNAMNLINDFNLLEKKSISINFDINDQQSLNQYRKNNEIHEVLQYMISNTDIIYMEGGAEEILNHIKDHAINNNIDTTSWGNTGKWFGNLMSKEKDIIEKYFDIRKVKRRGKKYYYFDRK